MTDDVSIKVIIDHMHPNYRSTFKSMLALKGASEDLPASEVRTLFDGAKLPSDERVALLAFYGGKSKQGITKFAPKLDFQKRCEIYALYLLGFKREVLAKTYNVDRRTVTHIHNAKSAHYKNVREEMLIMGEEKFIQQYASEDVRNRALTAGEPEVVGNNRHANRKAGVHTVRNQFCTGPHRVIIKWINEGEHNVPKSGWYYCDLDGDFPDSWLAPPDDPEALTTSQACFAAMLNDISDKLS